VSDALAGLPCLADEAGGVTDPAMAKDIAQCLKIAGKATTKLATTVYESLAKCHEAVLACVEQRPGDTKCLAKAGKACSGLLARIAAGRAASEAAVVDTCTDATVAALASECEAIGGTSDSVTAYATCLARSAACNAADAVALAAPRSAATFALAGVTFGSEGCTAP
jgi:hypothetical protein